MNTQLRTDKDLHPYQLAAKDHILRTPKCGLFLDMGLGKTVATLTAINELMFDYMEIRTVLVVAPKRVAQSVWTSEVKKWGHLNHLKVVRVIGDEKQRKKALKEPAHIYTIGRDNIRWLVGICGGVLPFDMLVLDELSSFKNHQSQRFKSLKIPTMGLKRVVGLTGTPAPNSLIDLWSQIYLLDGGQRLGKFITPYREQYFTRSFDGFSYALKDRNNVNLIMGKISDICISMKKEDYLSLKGVVNSTVEIKMPPELKEKYKQFEAEKVLSFLETDKEITALNAAGLSNKLLQFANGAVYDDAKTYHEVHDLKIEALAEIVETNQGKPILVAYSYKSDCERIMKYFKKIKTRLLQNETDIQEWNEGKIDMLVMHPASGGHGLNLQQGGNIIVWFGQTWSLELYQQLNARLHRQGQTEAVIIHHLAVKGTMDFDVLSSLERKDTMQESVMKAVKARIDKYINLKS